jgi:hypothetical protein
MPAMDGERGRDPVPRRPVWKDVPAPARPSGEPRPDRAGAADGARRHLLEAAG